MTAINEYLTQLQKDKTDLVTNLNTMNVEATDNETFTSLVPKVLNIANSTSETGKVYVYIYDMDGNFVTSSIKTGNVGDTYEITEMSGYIVYLTSGATTGTFTSDDIVFVGLVSSGAVLIKPTTAIFYRYVDKNGNGIDGYDYFKISTSDVISYSISDYIVDIDGYNFYGLNGLAGYPTGYTVDGEITVITLIYEKIEQEFTVTYSTTEISETTVKYSDWNDVLDLINSTVSTENGSLLTYIDITGGTGTKVSNFTTSMKNLFNDNYIYNTKLKTVSLNLDTSGVTDMSYVFKGRASLIDLFLNIDTSSVTNMSYMFYNCQSLESLDLSSLDFSNVTNYECMFSNCINLVEVWVKDETAQEIVTDALSNEGIEASININE